MTDKKDLTRIEDLSEYLHEEDSEVDDLLNTIPPAPPSGLNDLDDLPSDTEEEDSGLVTPFEEDRTDQFSFSSSEELDEESVEVEEEDLFDNSQLLSFENDSADSLDGEESDAFQVEEDSESGFLFESEPEQESESELGTEFEFESGPESESEYESELEVAPELEPESELKATPVLEPGPEPEFSTEFESEFSSEAMKAVPSSDFHPETFSDVKEFAQNVSYGVMAQGGNPPFSVILKNIKFKEDCDEIFSILKDHGLVSASSESDIKLGLENGSLLVSQLSEYCAIFLAHKLRRFDLEIQVGLSDELHPSKSYAHGELGPINKSALTQNRTESFHRNETPIDLKSVLLATTPGLEGFHVVRYLGIASEHALLKESELGSLDLEMQGIDVSETYNTLAEQLKLKALKKGGNAVLNVNYQFSPLPGAGDASLENVYKVTCAGNIVWVTDSGV